MEIGIGILGLGTVGGGVVETIRRNGALIEERTGLRISVKKAADLDESLFEALDLPPEICTTNADDVINDPDVHIVVETIGGATLATELTLKAMAAGKHVVTANKAMLAYHAEELSKAAADNGVDLRFEGSVGGGIPCLRALKEGLASNNIQSITGIVNGTCNFILTMMSGMGIDFDTALHDAQEKGFAEADPTLDIGGHDAAHKIVILASLAFATEVKLEDVHVEGIETITQSDIQFARDLGYVIKLLATVEAVGDGIAVRVCPTLVPMDSLLASIDREYNAVCVEGDITGRTIYYGKGAGRMPTAGAIVSDIIDIGRDMSHGSTGRVPPFQYNHKRRVASIEELETCYYVRLTTIDAAGVLAKICNIFASDNISIASVIQHPGDSNDSVPIIMMLHRTNEGKLRKALDDIDALECVKAKTTVIRVA